MNVIICGTGCTIETGEVVTYTEPLWETDVATIHAQVVRIATELANKCGSGDLSITVTPINP